LAQREPKTLTKVDVIQKIYESTGYQKKLAAETFEKLVEIIKRTLENGEDVLISGFGKFCVKKKNARKGRNPATNEEMILNSRRVVTFKCSRELRDKINKS
jgi:integration host factor subunit alpha